MPASLMNKIFEVIIGNPIGIKRDRVLILIQLNDSNYVLGKKHGFYPDHIARTGGGEKEGYEKRDRRRVKN